jgi:hypothetical protein
VGYAPSSRKRDHELAALVPSISARASQSGLRVPGEPLKFSMIEWGIGSQNHDAGACCRPLPRQTGWGDSVTNRHPRNHEIPRLSEIRKD